MKIKLTKGELKNQKGALRQYQRYLPILELKQQQLQMELLRQTALLEEKRHSLGKRTEGVLHWSALLAEEPGPDLRSWLIPQKIITRQKNIAGVGYPVFERAEFPPAEYDLFVAPLWVDAAVEQLRLLVVLRQEIAGIEEGIRILRQEMRITTQRVNLFEKIKIPEAEEAIRLLKIFIGDQMANAVGRSKIAKKKIEEYALEGNPV